jgi:hypothetical protein
MGNYSTSLRIYIVGYEIKGDNAKIPRETIKVKNVPRIRRSGALRMLAQLRNIPTPPVAPEKVTEVDAKDRCPTLVRTSPSFRAQQMFIFNFSARPPFK